MRLKMKKKIFVAIFLIAVLMANLSLASYNTVTMEVVEEPVCKIDISDNSSFEKKLVVKDLANKKVTLQLQVTNDEAPAIPTGEIMLVIDNSLSMDDPVSEAENALTRKEVVFKSAQTLITNLLKDNTKLKIGAVSFSTKSDSSEGTIEDANLVSSLTNSSEELSTAISNIEATGARTNLQSGLLLASQQFSNEENNKYMIVLTDGVPNVSVDFNNKYYSDDVISKTKQQLQTLANDSIDVITMLTGISNEDSLALRPSDETEKTYKEIITEIFGTETNPTAGKFYYIQDNEIEKTITENIYNDLMPESKTLKNIKIVDYFPKEIIDNFNFAYVSQANIGEISAKVDTTNNSITWSIPELASGKTATVQYTLSLKENFDNAIVGKILNTNEKVDITYTDFEGANQERKSDVTPKLKLSEPPVELPKAGLTTLIGFTVLAFGIVIFSGIKLNRLNKNMK